MKASKRFSAALLALFSILLASCLGMDARAKISAAGSGRIDLEYRISKDLVALGELEANKTSLPIPVSRQDMERGLASFPGLSLVSWSDRKDGGDLVVKTAIAFDKLQSLVSFMDPRGALASYTESGGKKTLVFVFGENLPELDAKTVSLAREAFAPYSMKLAIELPVVPSASTAVGEGAKGWIEGRTARFESPMAAIALSRSPASWTVSW